MQELDSPERYQELRRTLRRKGALRAFYREIYDEYARCLARCPGAGVALEIGSGAGFAKETIPELVTSDLIPYSGVDRVLDATALPYGDGTLRMICMNNVFHHIPDVAAFLAEAERCLAPGGRLLIADQHLGFFSRLIFKYLHHEPCDPHCSGWRFRGEGPLSDANGALAWVVFVRDLRQFVESFPSLQVVRYHPHAPLRYWLAGGLKRWTLLPRRLYRGARAFDELLLSLDTGLGSFVYIEIVKTTLTEIG